jgi:hypothetical protein
VRLTVLGLLVVSVVTAVFSIGTSGSQAANSYTFVANGQVLGPSNVGLSAGVASGQGTADVSAIILPNGQTRLYYGIITNSSAEVGSAISSDGINFAVEAGNRVAGSSPFVYPLPSGGYRLYYSALGGIESATSSDGLTFTSDPGMRIAQNGFGPVVGGHSSLNCSAIVRLANGTYRMYCSQAVKAATQPIDSLGDRAIFSATSPDLLNWTPDSGIRIGPGAPTLTGDSDHPTVIVNSDGSVTLIYTCQDPGSSSSITGPPPQEMIATSQDGLTFSSETDTGVSGTEPSVVSLSNGSLRLYYGNETPSTGSTISLATGSMATTTTTTVAPTSTTAPAKPAAHNVRVSVTVKGSGRVTGDGMRCPKTCAVTLASGKELSLRAIPASGYRFAGWGGSCKGLGACTLHPKAAVKITASFQRK